MRHDFVSAETMGPPNKERRQGSGNIRYAEGSGRVIERRGIQINALPPNKGMQLTAKSVLSFAKRRAKARPLLSAADARG